MRTENKKPRTRLSTEERDKDLALLRNPRSWVAGLIIGLGLLIILCCPDENLPIGKFVLLLGCQQLLGWSLVFGGWGLAKRWKRQGKLDLLDDD